MIALFSRSVGLSRSCIHMLEPAVATLNGFGLYLPCLPTSLAVSPILLGLAFYKRPSVLILVSDFAFDFQNCYWAHSNEKKEASH